MTDSAPIQLINDENFQKHVIDCPTPVIVVFEKSCWGTAQIIKPILEKVAFEFADKIKVFKYNLDENTITSSNFRIENAMTVLLFNKGNVIYKTGIISKEELRKIINSLLVTN